MSHRVRRVTAAVVLSVFAYLLISGTYFFEGPILLLLTTTHGVHLGDLGILLAWAVAMVALAAPW